MANRKQRRQNLNKREAARLASIHKAAVEAGMHESWMLMAAYCLATRELHRFGRKRLERIARRSARLVFDAMCAQELADRLKEETGIDLMDIYSEEEMRP